MSLFIKFIFSVHILILMSCGDVNKKKVSNKTNEKYYKIESIKEVDIVSEKIESYDTSKMKFIKGGKFIFGNDNGLDREKPEQEVIIQSFLIDKNLVTVEDFRDFVDESNYITEAEKFGNAIVFIDSINNWQLINGASWEYPLGLSLIHI